VQSGALQVSHRGIDVMRVLPVLVHAKCIVSAVACWQIV
jgi:hypothetical protein